MAVTLRPSYAVHQGEWLRTEIVAQHGPNVTVAAAKLGVTCQTELVSSITR